MSNGSSTTYDSLTNDKVLNKEQIVTKTQNSDDFQV